MSLFKRQRSRSYRTARVIAALPLLCVLGSLPRGAAQAQESAGAETAPVAPEPAVVEPPSQQAQTAAPTEQPHKPDLRQASAVALLVERESWRSRYTSVLGPVLLATGIVFTAVSAAPFLVAQSDRDSGDSYSEDADELSGGKYVFAEAQAKADARDKYNHASQMIRLGTGFAATGVLLFVTGIVLTSLRTSKRKQRREIQRIDNQLRSLASRASAAPWLDVRGSHAMGGISGALRF